MTQIRENIFHITDTDLGSPRDTGYATVEGLGEVLIDAADKRYIDEALAAGVEPSFFVSKSDALKGAYVVVSRQWPA